MSSMLVAGPRITIAIPGHIANSPNGKAATYLQGALDSVKDGIHVAVDTTGLHEETDFDALCEVVNRHLDRLGPIEMISSRNKLPQ